MNCSLPLRQIVTALGIALLAIAGLTVLTSTFADPAGAGVGVAQGRLVDDVPRRDTPVVLDGTVYAHAQVGDRVFVGGDFSQVRRPNGSVVTQQHIFAYNINTGEFDENFRPVLNNRVFSLETNAAGDGLYVGGRFYRWEADGAVAFPSRVAKLDAQGNLDRNFSAQASAQVMSMAVVNNDLYIGGDFRQVNGQNITGLARVDGTSGDLDTRLNLGLSNSVADSNIVRRVVAHPNGNELFVLHYNQRVQGQTRDAVLKLNINNRTPSLSGWNIPWQAQTNDNDCWEDLRDMAMSPDGSYIVIAGQGGDRPSNCDSVLRYPTSGNGTVNFTWSARMYSSVFSLAVSDVAVYVGGHFCGAPRNGAGVGRLTHNPAFGGRADACEINDPGNPVNPSSIFPSQAVFRNQMAALNPSTGQALNWNPGSNNNVGVFDLTLIDRGLLVGHDGSRFNQRQVGRSGFFDFGGFTDGVGAEAAECSVSLNNNGQPVISYSEFDGVSDVVIRRDGNYVDNAPAGTRNFVDTTAAPGRRTYLIRWRPGGNQTDVNCSPSITVPEPNGGNPGTCTVTLNGNGDPRLQWSNLGANSYVVRDSNGWVANVNGTSFTDANKAPGSYSYVIRYRIGGVQTDLSCSPSPITVGGGGGGGGANTCTASVRGNGDVQLNWSAIAGENEYIVRDNDGFVATRRNTLNFRDTNPDRGSQTYVIRSRMNGGTTDVTCNRVNVP